MTSQEEIAFLRALLAERNAELEAKADALSKEKKRAKKLVEKLRVVEFQLGLLKKQLYGRKSEKIDPRQLQLEFDEACAEAAADAPLTDEPFPEDLLRELAEAESEDQEEGKEKEGRPPRRRRRETKFPSTLEVVRDEEIHPPAEDLLCSCGCGKVRMGEETSRRLEVQPARFFWREQVRVKYICPSCRDITRPSLPPAPIEKSLAGTSLLVSVLLSKYLDHLPLDRLEKIYARDGVELSKRTLCSWIEAAVGLLEPIADEIQRSILSRSLGQTDETGILVLDREHPEGRFKGRMWVFCGESGELYYEYTPTKEALWPKRLLVDFTGILQADAYPGFDGLFTEDSGILEAGCNAHARRKFKDAHDAEPKREEPKWALLAYRRLFAVEREAKEHGLDADARLALRQKKSKKIVQGLYAWLKALKPRLVPSDPLYAAVRYALNQKEALSRFLEDGRVELDNNRSERSLRQVAVGRKNWLFAGSPKGAKWMAIAYSLIMSCTELEISPRDYLTDVLERVTTHPHDRIHELTPRGWKAAREAAAEREPELTAST